MSDGQRRLSTPSILYYFFAYFLVIFVLLFFFVFVLFVFCLFICDSLQSDSGMVWPGWSVSWPKVLLNFIHFVFLYCLYHFIFVFVAFSLCICSILALYL